MNKALNSCALSYLEIQASFWSETAAVNLQTSKDYLNLALFLDLVQ